MVHTIVIHTNLNTDTCLALMTSCRFYNYNMFWQIFVKYKTSWNLAQAGVRIQISMDYDFIRTLKKKCY